MKAFQFLVKRLLTKDTLYLTKITQILGVKDMSCVIINHIIHL